MMRIALVHSYYSSRSPSGENIAVEAQRDALIAAGHEVNVFAATTDIRSLEFGYEAKAAIGVLTGRGPSPVEDIKRFDPEIVHVHNLFPNWGTKWLSKWRGPLVATIHNFRPVCAAGTLFRDGHVCMECPQAGSYHAVLHGCYRDARLPSVPLAVRTRRSGKKDPLLRRADHLVVLTERSRALYESFGVPSSKLNMIPNFADDWGFSSRRLPRNEWVYLGRLSPEKGILALVRNWPPGQRLAIYGDGLERSEVEAVTSEWIRYRGPADRPAIRDVLANSIGLVFPSLCYEGGVPLTYVEALAASRPVVALAGNSAADDIAISGAGSVVQGWSELAQALEYVKRDVEHLGQLARDRYETRYTAAAWEQDMAALYRRARSMSGAL
jgi:glycosyltransferase involved in cell wall biosynthesis